MKVTPLDIRRKEFKRAVRGYADEEVDLFLDEVADEFERLHQEAADLQELYAQVRDAVRCHFAEAERPRIIRLHFVREELLAV